MEPEPCVWSAAWKPTTHLCRAERGINHHIGAYPGAWRNSEAMISDDKHLRVLLDQCQQVIEKIRKRAAREGTSIRLTYHLQRLCN